MPGILHWLPLNRKQPKRKKNYILKRVRLQKLKLYFRVGCANLVFVHLDDALHQVWPKAPEYKFIGDGAHIVCTDEYEIKEPPFTIQFHGWNTDELYNHTITIRIQIVPAKEILHKVIGEVMKYTKLSRPG